MGVGDSDSDGRGWGMRMGRTMVTTAATAYMGTVLTTILPLPSTLYTSHTCKPHYFIPRLFIFVIFNLATGVISRNKLPTPCLSPFLFLIPLNKHSSRSLSSSALSLKKNKLHEILNSLLHQTQSAQSQSISEKNENTLQSAY